MSRTTHVSGVSIDLGTAGLTSSFTGQGRLQAWNVSAVSARSAAFGLRLGLQRYSSSPVRTDRLTARIIHGSGYRRVPAVEPWCEDCLGVRSAEEVVMTTVTDAGFVEMRLGKVVGVRSASTLAVSQPRQQRTCVSTRTGPATAPSRPAAGPRPTCSPCSQPCTAAPSPTSSTWPTASISPQRICSSSTHTARTHPSPSTTPLRRRRTCQSSHRMCLPCPPTVRISVPFSTPRQRCLSPTRARRSRCVRVPGRHLPLDAGARFEWLLDRT